MRRKKGENAVFENFVALVRFQLKSDTKLILDAVRCLWRYQESEERHLKDSCKQNQMGFNKPDAKALSYLAIQLERGLRPWDWRVKDARSRMSKYAKQVACAMLSGDRERIKREYGIIVPNIPPR